MQRGVIYFAKGEKYLKECVVSAKSFKKYHPNINLCLFTPDTKFAHKVFNSIIHIDEQDSPFKTKVDALSKTPFEFTLFLDTDTVVKNSCYELFDFLLSYDMGVANRVKCDWGRETKFISYIDSESYNTGVVLYRMNNKIKKFFTIWKDQLFRQDAKTIVAGVFCDQYYFNKLIFQDQACKELQIKIVELPNKKYNARPHLLRQLKLDDELNEIKILHMHLDNSLKGKLNTLKTKLKHKTKEFFK